MPRVPEVPSLSTGLRGLPVPQARGLPPEALAGPGDALQRAGGMLARIALQAREREDAVRVTEADTRIATLATDLLTNTERGALTKRGKDALGVSEQTLQAFDKDVAAVRNSLTPLQRQAFDARAARQRESLAGSLNRHEYAERTRYGMETSRAAITAAQERAWADPTPDAIGNAEAAIVAAVQQQGRLAGMDVQAVTVAAQEQLSRLYAGSIARVLSGEPGTAQLAQARTLFGQYEKRMTADDAGRVRDALASAGRTEEAQGLYAQARAAAPNNRRQQIEWLRERASGEVLDKAISYADQDHGRRQQDLAAARAAENERKDRALADVWSTIEARRPLSQSQWLLLSQTPGMRSRAEARMREVANGTTAQTDLRVWRDLTVAAGEGRLTTGMVDAMRGALSESDYRALTEAASARRAGRVPSSVLPGPQQQTDQAIVKLGLAKSGDWSKMDDDELARAKAFRDVVDDRLQRAEAVKGRKLSDREFADEVLAPATRLVLTDDGGWFGPARTRVATQVEDDDADLRVPIARIPAALQAEYRGLLTDMAAQAGAGGVAVTDAMVERAAALQARGRLSPNLTPAELRALWSQITR